MRPLLPILGLALCLTGCPDEGSNTQPDSTAPDTASEDTRAEDTASPDIASADTAPIPDTAPAVDTPPTVDTTPATDTASPDTPPSTDPLADLDDDFSQPPVSSDWIVFNAPMFTYAIDAGQLVMEPLDDPCSSWPYCVWFNNDNGPMLYKNVAGDFVISASVQARSASNPSQPPPPDFHFAGLIARDPASDASQLENYVFTVMGDRGGYLTNEVKSTVDGSSNVVGPNEGITTADADLRLCRVGQRFLLYNRPYGSSQAWELEHTWDRANNPLGDTLQVGLIAYNYSNLVDILGRFDDVTFRTVSGESDCTREP